MGKLLALGLFLLAIVHACQGKDCFVEKKNQLIFNGNCLSADVTFWISRDELTMSFEMRAGDFDTRSARFYFGSCDSGDLIIERDHGYGRLRRLSDNQIAPMDAKVLIRPNLITYGNDGFYQFCNVEFTEKKGGYVMDFSMVFDSEPKRFSIVTGSSSSGIRILSQTDTTELTRYWWAYKIVLPILGVLILLLCSGLIFEIVYFVRRYRNEKKLNKELNPDDLEGNKSEVSMAFSDKRSDSYKTEPKKKKKKHRKSRKKSSKHSRPKKSKKPEEESSYVKVNAEVLEPLPESQTTILQTRLANRYEAERKLEKLKQDPKHEPQATDIGSLSSQPAADISVEPEGPKKKSVDYQVKSDGNKIYHLRALKKPKDNDKRTEEEELADL